MRAALCSLVLALAPCAGRAQDTEEDAFAKTVRPLLEDYCFSCHGNGLQKGNVDLATVEAVPTSDSQRDVWVRVLKNVRAGIMPPSTEAQPNPDERAALDAWIKREALGLDATRIDPGPSHLRRLNRVEYGNTIRDLMGVEFRADEEFPPDDTGYGFDTIAEVLAVSPLLLEKYMQAAQSIVADAVPTVAREVSRRQIHNRSLRKADGKRAGPSFSFYEEAGAETSWVVEQAGEYRVTVDLSIRSGFDFDPGRCEIAVTLDGHDVLRQEVTWASYKKLPVETTLMLEPGEHVIRFALKPLSDAATKKHDVGMFFESVTVTGPLAPEHWVRPRNFERFFFNGDAPETEPDRRAYAREILARFGKRAFRRPVDDQTLDRLMAIVAAAWSEPGATFEAGVARGIVAVLASPRFLFRIEETIGDAPDERFRPVDEWTLASRLSYFLWSTMPDNELLELAERGQLRANLDGQLKRLLADERAHELVSNFVGQWLQTRDIEGVSINGAAVLRRDRVRGKQFDFDRDLRLAMKRETEMLVEHVMREDRDIIELIDNNYTFLNEELAKHYGIDDVEGDQMRKVDLPEDSPRGGILAHGSFLAVTSNPTRTSPVKRGLFVLDNILGTPAPPPPADVPLLEEAEKAIEGHDPSLREALELHRKQPLCNACHARFDPIGLALENFNAVGMWRDKDRDNPIDPSGTLLSGESFDGIRTLRRILAEQHARDFERCLTEKLLIYAIGRGLEYYDIETVDQIVERLEQNQRKFSSVLVGIVESSPFQRRRAGGLSPDPAPRSSVEAKP